MAMREMLRRMLDERAQVWEGSKALLDSVEKRSTDKQSFTAEEQKEWDSRSEQLNSLDEKITNLSRDIEREDQAAHARSGYDKLAHPTDADRRSEDDASKPLHQRESYARAFDNFVRRGMNRISEADRALMEGGFQSPDETQSRALGTTSGSIGGYLVPQGFYDELTKAMKFYGGMIDPGQMNPFDQTDNADAATSVGVTLLETTTGNPLPMPTVNDSNNMGARLAENSPITQQDVAFGQITLGAYTYTSKLILVPWQLLTDSAFDLDTYIPRLAGERLGRILNNELTVGTGTGMPNGVLTAAPVGVQAATGGTVTVTYDNLIDLEASVDLAYRPRGKYMFNDSTLTVLRKLKDTQGHPLWQPSLQAAVPSLFNGRSYVINNDMPVQAASAKSVLFGDYSNYTTRLVGQGSLVRLDERYADQLQTGFFVWLRADGNLLNAGSNPIKAFQQSAT